MHPPRSSGPDPPSPAERRSTERGAWTRRPVLLLHLLLAALTLVAFQPALDNGLVDFDDPLYLGQPQVRQGLHLAGVRWALTAVVSNGWYPLTLLSHMADVSLFGLEPRGHHLTSVLLHLLSAQLLFWLLRRATSRLWPPALAAGLFALHPLRVESVAWVAERKDVLSVLFGLLAIALYVRYAAAPKPGRYLAVAGAYLLSLAAKATLVTLPFVLLLLDRWPLGRWRSLSDCRRLLVEKVPLLLSAAACAALALATQSGSVRPVAELGLGLRAATATVAYAAYLRQTLWPTDLAAFYPYRPELAASDVVPAAALLVVLTVAALAAARRAPYLLVGWLWFLGTAVPVIGLVQIGIQARADRYTYFPSIGLAVAAAWGGAALWDRFARLRLPLAAAAALSLLALVALTRTQIPWWADTATLFRRSIAVAGPSNLAYLNLAEALRQGGDRRAALDSYEKAIALAPMDGESHAALGSALVSWGRPAAALPHLERAVALDPRDPRFRFALAQAAADTGRTELAVAQLRAAVALDPAFAQAHYGLGALLERRGDLAEALRCYRRAAALDPGLPGLAERIKAFGDATADPPAAPP